MFARQLIKFLGDSNPDLDIEEIGRASSYMVYDKAYNNISKLTAELDTMHNSNTYLKTPINVIEDYIELTKNRENTFNKKRKDTDKKIQMIIGEYKFVEKDCSSYAKTMEKEAQLDSYQKQYDITTNYIQYGVNSVIKLLTDNNYVEYSPDVPNLRLTMKGIPKFGYPKELVNLMIW
jgi:chromosome segregation ATPase